MTETQEDAQKKYQIKPQNLKMLLQSDNTQILIVKAMKVPMFLNMKTKE